MSNFGTLVLNNGLQIPRVGLGTFLASGNEVKKGVAAALRAGIRSIDTAQLYRNERQIAEAIRESGVPRGDIFVTSKVGPYQQGTTRARAAVEDSVNSLGTSYLDLCLIHWPGASRVPAQSPDNAALRLETWRVLEDMQRQGRCKSIGVSNYNERHLTELLNVADTKPVANQIEVHPRLPQHELRSACQQMGIAVIAYSPFGGEGGELLRHPTVLAVSQEAKKTPAQVLIQWSLQQGNVVIPKSVQERHIQQWGIGTQVWNLTDKEMQALNSMADGHRYCWDANDTA